MAAYALPAALGAARFAGALRVGALALTVLFPALLPTLAPVPDSAGLARLLAVALALACSVPLDVSGDMAVETACLN